MLELLINSVIRTLVMAFDSSVWPWLLYGTLIEIDYFLHTAQVIRLVSYMAGSCVSFSVVVLLQLI